MFFKPENAPKPFSATCWVAYDENSSRPPGWLGRGTPKQLSAPRLWLVDLCRLTGVVDGAGWPIDWPGGPVGEPVNNATWPGFIGPVFRQYP